MLPSERETEAAQSGDSGIACRHIEEVPRKTTTATPADTAAIPSVHALHRQPDTRSIRRA
jgi:hypothetical protein